MHDLKYSEKPVAEIAREAHVSRQTLYDWQQQHDLALDLAWGRVGGLQQLSELEAALAESQRAERSARDEAATGQPRDGPPTDRERVPP